MCISLRKHTATELRGLDWCENSYPSIYRFTIRLISRVNSVFKLSRSSRILEIGCAQGLVLASLKELGYEHVLGIEPSLNAIRISKIFSKKRKLKLNIERGYAEKLPFANESFDLVIADSVMEHVADVHQATREIFRVLKPGGACYIATTSILCPLQGEIRFFPFFSWYPSGLKVEIMRWAKDRHPSLIGGTDYPAFYWYSPSILKKIFHKLGFKKFFGRCDFVEEGKIRTIPVRIKRFASHSIILKCMLDFFVPGYSCLIVK